MDSDPKLYHFVSTSCLEYCKCESSSPPSERSRSTWESSVAACHLSHPFSGNSTRSPYNSHASPESCLDLIGGLAKAIPPLEVLSPSAPNVMPLVLQLSRSRSAKTSGLERCSEWQLGTCSLGGVRWTRRQLAYGVPIVLRVHSWRKGLRTSWKSVHAFKMGRLERWTLFLNLWLNCSYRVKLSLWTSGLS